MSDARQLLDAILGQRRQRVQATLEESKALAAKSREMVTAMFRVVELAKGLVLLAQGTVDLSDIGNILTNVALIYHKLDETADQWEQRAKQIELQQLRDRG